MKIVQVMHARVKMKTIPILIILFFGQETFAFKAQADTILFNFTNLRNDRISGQIILPQKHKPKTPVLIFLVGSGESSFQTNYKNFLEENFENQLLDSGIALCYFDKPGIGNSKGKWYQQTFYDRASDVNDCIAYLRSTSYIDPDNIGVVGHSQGGWVAQLAAAQYPDKINYMISLAGPSYSVKRQLISDFQSSLICKGVEELKAQKQAIEKTNLVFFLSKFFPFSNNLKQLRKIRNYTPEKTISKIKSPTLFLFGENDRLVYKEWCIESLNDIFSNKIPAHIQYSVIENVNHSFEIEPFCSDKVKKDLKYSTQFQKELKNFIINNVR